MKHTFPKGTVMTAKAKLKLHGVTETVFNIVIRKEQYNQGRGLALIADEANGQPFCTLSINIVSDANQPCALPSSKLPLDHCYFKTWSENEGFMEQLEAQGLIKQNGPRHQYTGAQIVKVLF